MPWHLTRPPFISYDGKADPVEHISHYIQMMSLYSQNDALLCKVLPSSFGPTSLRWINELRRGSIHNFDELIQEFGAQFMTSSRVPQLVNALLSMKIGVGETLRNYANHYWELYNEISGGNKKVVASTFRLTLPQDSELRDSLTMRPPENMHQLIRCIKEYKRLKDDRKQSKGKALATSQYAKDSLRIQEPNV